MPCFLVHILVDYRKIYICVFSCLLLTMIGYNTHGYETSNMHETRSMAATPSASHSILSSPPTYDGIGTDEYIEWEVAIDNIFHNVECVNGEKLRMPLVF